MGERTVFYKGLIMGMVVMAFANFFGNRALSSPRATKLNEIYKVLDNYYIEYYDK